MPRGLWNDGFMANDLGLRIRASGFRVAVGDLHLATEGKGERSRISSVGFIKPFESEIENGTKGYDDIFDTRSSAGSRACLLSQVRGARFKDQSHHNCCYSRSTLYILHPFPFESHRVLNPPVEPLIPSLSRWIADKWCQTATRSEFVTSLERRSAHQSSLERRGQDYIFLCP